MDGWDGMAERWQKGMVRAKMVKREKVEWTST
jgi:hypothetical protein